MLPKGSCEFIGTNSNIPLDESFTHMDTKLSHWLYDLGTVTASFQR